MAARIPVIIDCDPGTDDALALLLAFASPELDVRAVTVVAGNVGLERTVANARAIVGLAGADAPVFAGADRPFFGIYLPAAPENRQASQRSLIGPDDRFTPGGMIELDTGSARYLIRFTQTLERQTGWTWTLFNAVRKLAP